jgi:hypothetical protein
METSLHDSSYHPPDGDPLDDDFSADDSANLGEIYSPGASDEFDIQDFEIALSQQAYLHFQQIQQHALAQAPSRQHKFSTLFEEAVKTNQDPAILEETLQGWLAHQP